jgi:hypothetical protein
MTTEDPEDHPEIGYGCPPRHTRFQRGQSGNPDGRRKGVRTLAIDVKRTLRATVKLKDNGKVKRVSTQEAALMRLKEKALKGDQRALDRLLELARSYNVEADAARQDEELDGDDQAILDAFREEIRTEPRQYEAQPGDTNGGGGRADE